MPGKIVKLDAETRLALEMLADDSGLGFHDLAEEAFRDLLKKRGRKVARKKKVVKPSAEVLHIDQHRKRKP